MKMGRLMMVLCLFVVGAGCTKGGDKAVVRALSGDNCPIETVEWSAPGDKDPKLEVKAGQTLFVFARIKAMRTKMTIAASGERVVPLSEWRDGKETLWYGLAPKECWGKESFGGVEITCVKCSTNLQNDPKLNEPCCLKN